ncbi:MAG: VOC family protein [Chloroflexi bacterium]|nr:VOC family protein [Chloroflexota bacterium]
MPARNEREKRLSAEVKSVEEAARIGEAFRKRSGKVMVKSVSHIGIVVKDIYEALATFDKHMEFIRNVQVEYLPEQGVKVAVVSLGGTDLEFIEPAQAGTGVARFLEKRGEGLHHIGFEVNDIRESLKVMGAKGAQLIDKEPWQGIRGLTAFVHPSSLKGVLVELVQKP